MKLVNNITKGSWMSQNVDTVYPNTIQNVAVEQEIFTFPEPPSSPPVFSRVRVARSLVFCVCFDRCLFFCPFSFDYCVVYSSITNSDYLFYLQTLLVEKTAVYFAGNLQILSVAYIDNACSANAEGFDRQTAEEDFDDTKRAMIICKS
jgi:hypothetical protein